MNAEEAKKLRAPFDKAAIGKLPKGGVMLDYVGHAATTDRLLQVDPEWSWEPFALDAQGLPAIDQAGNLWIKLTVCGVTRPGVGDGRTMKERIGDAIRNAAMRFGVAIDLWAKEDLHAADNPEHPTVQDRPPQQMRAMISEPQGKKIAVLMRDLGMSDRAAALKWVADTIGREVASRNDLTAREASQVIDALTKAQAEKVNPATGEVGTEDPWAIPVAEVKA